MQSNRHRLSTRLRVALGDSDRVLLVETHQHLWLVVPKMVDHTVMKTTIARPGVQSDVINSEATKHLSSYVTAIPNPVVDIFWPINLIQEFLTVHFCRHADPGAAEVWGFQLIAFSSV